MSLSKTHQSLFSTGSVLTYLTKNADWDVKTKSNITQLSILLSTDLFSYVAHGPKSHLCVAYGPKPIQLSNHILL